MLYMNIKLLVKSAVEAQEVSDGVHDLKAISSCSPLIPSTSSHSTTMGVTGEVQAGGPLIPTPLAPAVGPGMAFSSLTT